MGNVTLRRSSVLQYASIDMLNNGEFSPIELTGQLWFYAAPRRAPPSDVELTNLIILLLSQWLHFNRVGISCRCYLVSLPHQACKW